MEFKPAELADGSLEKVFIVVCKGKLLCLDGQPGLPLPLATLPVTVSSLLDADLSQAHYIGDFRSNHCYVFQATALDDLEPGARFSWLGLRDLLGIIPEERFQMLGRAQQIVRWEYEHRFCGICGGLTRDLAGERARICSSCDHHYYPRISPCIICLVYQGDKCLLARSAKLPDGVYSTLAGFIEPGENVEQALEREIMEEVGIRVGNLRYFASQVWPFPGQLMLGFTAEYKEGEIQPDGEEILEAKWFNADSLPLVPPESTISGRLIRSFVEGYMEASA